jgi:hypothetical protein
VVRRKPAGQYRLLPDLFERLLLSSIESIIAKVEVAGKAGAVYFNPEPSLTANSMRSHQLRHLL